MKWIAFLCLATVLQAQDWIDRGGDSNYAPDAFLVGLGSSTESFEDASQNAQIEVRRQIQVNLRSTLKQELSSTQSQGEQNAYAQIESKSTAWTMGKLEGVEVVHRAKRGTHYYALAVLDKKKYREKLRIQFQRRIDSLTVFESRAQKSIEMGEYGKALQWLDLLDKELKSGTSAQEELRVFGVDQSAEDKLRLNQAALLEKIFGVQMHVQQSDSGWSVQVKPQVHIPMLLSVDQKRMGADLSAGTFIPYSTYGLEPGLHGFELQLGTRDFDLLNPKIRWNHKIANPWPRCLLSSNNVKFNIKLNKWFFKSINPYNIEFKLKTRLVESIDSDYKSMPKKYLVQIGIQGKDSNSIQIQKSVIAAQPSVAEEKAVEQIRWDEIKEFLDLECSE